MKYRVYCDVILRAESDRQAIEMAAALLARGQYADLVLAGQVKVQQISYSNREAVQFGNGHGARGNLEVTRAKIPTDPGVRGGTQSAPRGRSAANKRKSRINPVQ